MRNKKRIKPFLDEVRVFWEANQDLRFGQVIYILAEELKQDIFFPEEEEWLKALRNLKTQWSK
jgi:hypothetical protein